MAVFIKNLVVVAFLALASAQGAESPPNVDGAGAFVTGHYRNLFAENGHSQNEIQGKIDGAFRQLFHGDPTNETIY